MATASSACKQGEELSDSSDSPSTEVLLAVKMQLLWMRTGSEWKLQPVMPGRSLSQNRKLTRSMLCCDTQVTVLVEKKIRNAEQHKSIANKIKYN